MRVKALDYLDTGRLIGQHDLTQVFRVELTGESCGVGQVREEVLELAGVGLKRPRGGTWRETLERVVCLADGLRFVLGRWRRGHLDGCRVVCPAQATARVIDHLRVRVEEFILQDCKLVVIEGELELQRVIGHSATPLEKSYDLVEDIIQVHPSPFLPERSRAASSGLPPMLLVRLYESTDPGAAAA